MSQKINGVALPDGTKTGTGSLATPEVKAFWAKVRQHWEYLEARGVPPHSRKRIIAEKSGLTRRQIKRALQNWKRARKDGNL